MLSIKLRAVTTRGSTVIVRGADIRYVVAAWNRHPAIDPGYRLNSANVSFAELISDVLSLPSSMQAIVSFGHA